MTFYRKIFLAVFVTSSVILIVSVAAAYFFISRSVIASYHDRYAQFSRNLAKAIMELEESTEQTMGSALEALRLYTDGLPIPSHEKAKSLEGSLNVSSIEFVDGSGNFLVSTSYDINELPNFFRFCEEYRRMFTGESPHEYTPLMPSMVDNRVWKYAMMPTSDRKYVIDVGTEIYFVGDLLRNVMENDGNIISIGLFTPTGISLGSFFRDHRERLQRDTRVMQSLSRGISVFRNRIEVVARVSATTERCCECVTKKMIAAIDDPFFYVLKTEVSLGALQASVNKLKMITIFFGGIALIIGFVISKTIAGKLFKKIDVVNRKTDELATLRDLGTRLNIPGNDEISSIGRRFDKLLDSLESAQRKIMELERTKAVASVSYNVAHDMRSPLSVLSTYVRMKNDEDDPDMRELHGASKRSVGKLVQMADDLVNYAKASKVERAPHCMRRVMLDGVVAETKTKAAEMGIELRMHIAGEIKANIDGAKIERVLVNVVNNAIQSHSTSSRHQSLGGQAGRVVVSAGAKGHGELIITVSDTGEGIAAEDLPRIFDNLFTKGKKGGTGLGLAYCKQVVEAHGGTIEVESEVGKGTTFTIILPDSVVK